MSLPAITVALQRIMVGQPCNLVILPHELHRKSLGYVPACVDVSTAI